MVMRMGGPHGIFLYYIIHLRKKQVRTEEPSAEPGSLGAYYFSRFMIGLSGAAWPHKIWLLRPNPGL